MTAAAPHARRAAAFRPERGRGGAASLDQALPLVKRALKVLVDREVSPQLGLLKSTLLQLDSSFSERDYGASTFRDFAEKLEQRGLVTLKHSGRTTLVELSESRRVGSSRRAAPVARRTQRPRRPVRACRRAVVDGSAAGAARGAEPLPELSLADGVALVREVLAEATTPPRWPMYLRQMKQFIRTARPDFDERRYGSLPDLLRACQKDGLLRLERDRQGGLRAFAGSYRASSVPHGWGTLAPPPRPTSSSTRQQPMTLARAAARGTSPNRRQRLSSRRRARRQWRRRPSRPRRAASPRTINWRCLASWLLAIRSRSAVRGARKPRKLAGGQDAVRPSKAKAGPRRGTRRAYSYTVST